MTAPPIPPPFFCTRPGWARPLGFMGLLFAALLGACGGGSLTAPPCNGTVPPGNPPPIVLGDFPRLVNTPRAAISGLRAANSNVLVGATHSLPGTCDHLWQTTITLPNEGSNTFVVVAEGDNLNRSTPVTLTMVLDTQAPLPPTINPLDTTPGAIDPLAASTAQGTITITGLRDPGATVYLNQIPLIRPATAEAGTTLIPFSANVTLTSGAGQANALAFTQVDGAGNVSPETVATVTRTSTVGGLPALVYPLNGERVARNNLGVVTLRFGRVTGALGFHLQVADNPGFANPDLTPLLMDAPPTSLFEDFTPPADGTFYWRVGTTDALGNVSYGPARHFTVGPLAGSQPGDVNGDGFSDIIVGNPGQDRIITDTDDNRGGLKLFLGRATLGNNFLETATLNIEGPQSGAVFGASVTSGDLNGDGFADMIASAPLADTTAANSGAVHILYGGTLPDADIDQTLNAFNSQDGFGDPVISGFDFNGDGFHDLAVGAFQYDDPNLGGNDNRGRAYLWFGGPPQGGTIGDPIDTVPDLIFTGPAPFANFGGAMAAGFDFNGDGYDDLAIGAAAADNFATDSGQVTVYFGGPNADTVADITLRGDNPGEHFGAAVSGAGDMDGDGFDELAVGAPSFSPGGTQSLGRMAIFAGAPSLTTAPITTPAFVVNGLGACESFPFRLSGGADLNGDGLADLVAGVPFSNLASSDIACVAAPGAPPLSGDHGLLQVYFGSTPLSGAATWGARFTGTRPNDNLGFGLNLSGDINGDGAPDLVAGAPQNDLGSPIFGNTGRAYVIFGPGDGVSTGDPTSPGWAAPPNHTNVSQLDPSSATRLDGATLTNDGGVGDGMGTSLH